MKKIRTILIAVAALLPLTSCMRWHTADRLRDAHTTYTGVDIYHPADGKLYYSPAENAEGLLYKDVSFTNYLIAPEVTYRRRSNLINSDGFCTFYPEPDYTQDVRPTGNTRVVKIKRGHSHPDSPEIIPTLPKGLKSLPMPPKGKLTFLPAKLPREGEIPMGTLGIFEKKEEKPSIGRRALIGTCDYVIDPMLNLITMPVELTCWIVGVPIAAGISGVMSLIPNDKEKAEMTPDN